MGLRDVAALAEAIVDAARLGLDPGGAAVLERYQRWRRFDTMAMGVATDGLNRLFSNRSDALRLVRDVGLGLVDRAAGAQAACSSARPRASPARCRSCCAARRCSVCVRAMPSRVHGQRHRRAICSLNAGRDEIAAYQRSRFGVAGRSGMSCM